MNNYDPWSTHIPALALAVMKFGPRVLEIGCGWYSTPLLHTLSPSVITIETDAEWAAKFASVVRTNISVVPDIRAAAQVFSTSPFDVVFVDCDPVKERVPCVSLFLDKPCCVVAHDTEVNNYTLLLSLVKYARHFDFVMPRTSWLSNVLDITK